MTQETAAAAPAGRIVWHDLMSTDPAASESFYKSLFGWEVNAVPMKGMGPDGGEGTYSMIRVGESDIGGMIPLDLPEGAEGVPSHWIGYVQVDDVDSAAKAAAESGGQTCVPPTDIPNVGRFSVITDPAGAVISPFKSAHGPIPDEEQPQVGAFCWDELLTREPDACARFYTSVFPWRQETMSMGEMGDYHLFKRGNDKDGAGMMPMPPEAQAPSHWLPYVLVEDVDAKAEEAKSLGATCHVEPRDIPGIGRFAVFSDPTGAAFAIYKNAPPAEQGGE